MTFSIHNKTFKQMLYKVSLVSLALVSAVGLAKQHNDYSIHSAGEITAQPVSSQSSPCPRYPRCDEASVIQHENNKNSD